MNNHSQNTSTKIYIFLIIFLAVLAGISIYLPQGSFMENIRNESLPASKPVMALINALVMLLIYGGLGYVGLRLSRKLKFPAIWDNKISNRKRFIIPWVAGIMLGAAFIGMDTLISEYSETDPLPHPPFPTSLVASLTAGIGEEVLFRLFFIPFWVWLIGYKLFKQRHLTKIFWIVTGFSALAFAAMHIPSLMMLYNLENIKEIPFLQLFELIVLNGSLSVLAAWYLKKYGFLAAVGLHFWTDVIWHVVWGLIR